MELRQSLLVAFGGNAALLLVLGFLGRSLISNVLSKDLEKFKGELQLAATEHQIRFAKLHEKRAEVSADLYKLLVVATWHAANLASPALFAGSPDKNTQYLTAMNAIAEYFRFFDQHRIWIPAELCQPLEDFARKLRTPMIAVGVYLELPNATADTARDRMKAWNDAWNSAQNEIPELRNAIEAEFRKLLGSDGG